MCCWIYWLLAIGSLLLGILYNSTLAGGPLWLVVGWLSVFLLINIFQAGLLVYQQLEVALPEDERKLLAIAFPTMRSRDWKKLRMAARVVECDAGEALVAPGDERSHNMRRAR